MEIPEEVQQFKEIAAEYCRWAETGPGDDEDEIYTTLILLSGLYHQALVLPGADPDPDAMVGEGITKLGAKHIYTRFQSLQVQNYHQIWNPVAETPEPPVNSDLAEDLMDIYVDIKEGLQLYEDADPATAVFHWTFTFGVHWGRHLTNALRVLHCFSCDPDLMDEEEDIEAS